MARATVASSLTRGNRRNKRNQLPCPDSIFNLVKCDTLTNRITASSPAQPLLFFTGLTTQRLCMAPLSHIGGKAAAGAGRLAFSGRLRRCLQRERRAVQLPRRLPRASRVAHGAAYPEGD